MIPKFEIVDVSNEDGLSIKAIIVDDERFVGYIFHFNKIDFDFQLDGIGISYDLIIDIHKNFLPTTMTDEKTALIKETAHSILEKLMTDFVAAHNGGTLDNPAEMV